MMDSKHLIFDEDEDDHLKLEGLDLDTDFSLLNKDELYRRVYNAVFAQALRHNPNPSILSLAAKLVKLGEKDNVEIEMSTEEIIKKIKEMSL
jgi:hypothetical protein